MLAGLRVIKADDCTGIRAYGPCLSSEAIIGDGREPWCAECGAYRQKLRARVATFLTEIIAKFGRPTAPITLRREFIRSPYPILHGNPPN
jgi:hypothetical protein